MGVERSLDGPVQRGPVDVAGAFVELRLVTRFASVPADPISFDPAITAWLPR